jgi:hypothetical protein
MASDSAFPKWVNALADKAFSGEMGEIQGP